MYISFYIVVLYCIHIFNSLQERQTSLHYGAQNGHKLIVAALVNLGANANAVDWVSCGQYENSLYM